MARPRRTAPRRRRRQDFETLDPGEQPFLLWALGCGQGFAGMDYDREFLEDAWEAFRDEVLADQPAGTRPWAWWAFDWIPEHGEPPVVNPDYQPGGKYHQHLDNWRTAGILYGSPAQEDQTAFLRRHGELTTDEEAILAEEAKQAAEFRARHPEAYGTRAGGQ